MSVFVIPECAWNRNRGGGNVLLFVFIWFFIFPKTHGQADSSPLLDPKVTALLLPTEPKQRRSDKTDLVSSLFLPRQSIYGLASAGFWLLGCPRD